MGCHHAKALQLNQFIRTGKTERVLNELAFFDPSKRDPTGASPFFTACMCGEHDLVEAMMNGKRGSCIDSDHMSEALWRMCGGNVDVKIVSLLLDHRRWGGRFAKADYSDAKSLDTALHQLSRKSYGTRPEENVKRVYCIEILAKSGFDVRAKNVDKKTPLAVALHHQFERAAVKLIELGADLMTVTKHMKSSKIASKCWCSSSMLEKYAFQHPLFVDRLRKEFMAEFDPDMSGELDKKELLRFIAFHVKMAFKAGMNPVGDAFADDGSLEIEQIEKLLVERCPDLIQQYHALDDDNNGVFHWDELLPIIKDFYAKLWTHSRPATAGKDEYLSDEDEEKMKILLEPILSSTTKLPQVKTNDGSLRSSKYVAQTNNGSTRKPQNLKTVKTAAPIGPLPNGWKAHLDSKSGKYYYHNSDTGATVWKRPRSDIVKRD